MLEAYRRGEGKWSVIYETVLLSDPVGDEERFRAIIDEGIRKKEVKAYTAYTKETQRAKEQRMKDAKREGKEAMEYAEKLGVSEQLFGKKDGKKSDGEAGLAALIKSRQAGRSSFFDNLEAKYAASDKGSKSKKGKKRGSEQGDQEPSEEPFQAAAAKLKTGKAAKSKSGKKRASESADEDQEMPSEEAFQAAAARLKNGTADGRKAKRVKH